MSPCTFRDYIPTHMGDGVSSIWPQRRLPSVGEGVVGEAHSFKQLCSHLQRCRTHLDKGRDNKISATMALTMPGTP
jgi:hypothetical protein